MSDAPTKSLDRHAFIAASPGAAAAIVAAGSERAKAIKKSTSPFPPSMGSLFPKDFAWGTATSALQVEGFPYEDGGGRSVWSGLDSNPQSVADGSNPLIADDTYHRWADDLPLIQKMGARNYRLSISWPRVMPLGRGVVNDAGLAYYDRLLDGLLKAEVTPWVTVHHFEYPESLQQLGGWLHEDSPRWFADYAHLIASRFSDRVCHWFTINEPNVFWAAGAEAGRMRPFHDLSREQLALGAHHILLGHGRAVQALRAAAKRPIEVGLPFSGQMSLPHTESAVDIEAARKDTFTVKGRELFSGTPPLLMLNTAWWLDPVYLGAYPEEGLAQLANADRLTSLDDLATIHQHLDSCCVNLYWAPRVRAGRNGVPEQVPIPADAPRTHYGWTITPDLLFWGPRFLYDRYQKPILITENGIALADTLTAEGRVLDEQRSSFLRSYLASLLQASQSKVPLRGYFHWSLLDNWEWTSGFKEQFGLVYVNRQTLARTEKDSFRTYADIIRSRGGILQQPA